MNFLLLIPAPAGALHLPAQLRRHFLCCGLGRPGTVSWSSRAGKGRTGSAVTYLALLLAPSPQAGFSSCAPCVRLVSQFLTVRLVPPTQFPTSRTGLPKPHR